MLHFSSPCGMTYMDLQQPFTSGRLSSGSAEGLARGPIRAMAKLMSLAAA